METLPKFTPFINPLEETLRSEEIKGEVKKTEQKPHGIHFHLIVDLMPEEEMEYNKALMEAWRSDSRSRGLEFLQHINRG